MKDLLITIEYYLNDFFSRVQNDTKEFAKYVFNFTKAIIIFSFAKLGITKAQLSVLKIIYFNYWENYSKKVRKWIGEDVLKSWLDNLSNKNSAEAINLLGNFYRFKQHDLTNQSYSEAKNLSDEEFAKLLEDPDYIQKSEELGGQICSCIKKAFDCYRKASELNFALAQFNVYRIYDSYPNPLESYVKIDALKYLENAAKNGLPNAQFVWAKELLQKDKLKQAIPFIAASAKAPKKNWVRDEGWYGDQKAAKKWIKKFHKIDEVEPKAFAGDTQAMYIYSEFIRDGSFKHDSLWRSHEWHTKAAKAGHSRAMGEEAYFIIHGWVEGTLEDAFNYFQKAVDAGCKDAHEGLGDCYLHGWGVEQNYEKAKYHYKKIRMGYKLKGITAQNIKEKIDGDQALKNDRDFYN